MDPRDSAVKFKYFSQFLQTALHEDDREWANNFILNNFVMHTNPKNGLWWV